ncbi:hypothetical protein [Zavarzinia aquatilis]|uniref:hypothetical protein n=1 Tax=Zavarzinia aquatilis TaxID=2211142 RepID=UPI0014041351|nr:hypothetical protein [Zavarzinia aquatilis]
MTDDLIAPFLTALKPLIDSRDHEAAIASIEARMAADPVDPAALIGLGFVAFASDQVLTALDALKQALDAAPGSAVAADSLAILYAIAGEVAEATYYAKLAQANGLDQTTASLRPAGWPGFAFVFRNIRERPLLAQGMKLMAAGQSDLAMRLIEAQAAFSPEDGETQRAFADALIAVGRPRQAAEILSRFAANGTADAFDLARLALALATIGDSAADGIAAEAIALGESEPAAGPDVLCAAATIATLRGADPARSLSRNAGLLPAAGPLMPAAALPERPRVGVLATALGDEADVETIAALAQGLREAGCGDLTVFGAGTLDRPHNRPLQGRVQRHIDAAAFDGETLAHTVAGEGIDLLLDAGGLAAPMHTLALAHHPALRTLAWLNAPCALPWTDGAVPAGAALARLGTTARPARSDGPTLIGTDIVPGQLHDDFLDALAALLDQVPDARLLFRDREFSHPDTVAALVERCGPRGIADRIEIVDGSPLAFAAGLDLYVAPFVALNGQDVVTATAVATPCVALRGTVRHRNHGAAALDALGLGDHAAADVAAFVAIGAALATDRGASARIAEAAATAPAFSPAAFATALMESIAQ